MISFEMQNVGAGVKQNYQLSKGNATGVEALPEDSELTDGVQNSRPAEIYNLCGQRLPHLGRGINIVRNPGGCAHKVYMK